MLSLYGHEATPSASYLLRLLQLQSEAMQDSLLWRISPEIGLVLNFVGTHRDCINAIVLYKAVDLPGCLCYASWRTSTWCHLKREVSFLGRQ